MLYSQEYEDGTHCAANSKPRRTRVDFYCDTYAAGGQVSTVADKGADFRVLDISEPDWCSYLFKVSTKYMCTGVAQLPKASHRVNGGAASRLQRKDVAL